MCPLLVCFLWMLLALSIESKQKGSVQLKRKVIMESVETNCDHDFVEYFHKVPNQELLYTFRVVKTAPSFTFSLIMRTVRSQRVMYQINKMDGCLFIKNKFMNKVLYKSYSALLVNNTLFTCPIKPKVYYLQNLTNALIVPKIHPIGHYQLRMSVQMQQSPAPFVMEIVWKYSVENSKQ